MFKCLIFLIFTNFSHFTFVLTRKLNWLPVLTPVLGTPNGRLSSAGCSCQLRAKCCPELNSQFFPFQNKLYWDRTLSTNFVLHSGSSCTQLMLNFLVKTSVCTLVKTYVSKWKSGKNQTDYTNSKKYKNYIGRKLEDYGKSEFELLYIFAVNFEIWIIFRGRTFGHKFCLKSTIYFRADGRY